VELNKLIIYVGTYLRQYLPDLYLFKYFSLSWYYSIFHLGFFLRRRTSLYVCMYVCMYACMYVCRAPLGTTLLNVCTFLLSMVDTDTLVRNISVISNDAFYISK
jgi:hypothetical protein